MTQKCRRFSELRPSRVDSNLFQYHLKKLITDGYVAKVPGGYTLSARGLYYADRHSSALKAERQQPKIIAIIIVENPKGDILLLQKPQQPFLGDYHLPAGKVHEGEDIEAAARRELREKVALDLDNISYHATVHVTIREADAIISEYYGIVLKTRYDGQLPIGGWYQANDELSLCPSVPEILSLINKQPGDMHEWNIDVAQA